MANLNNESKTEIADELNNSYAQAVEEFNNPENQNVADTATSEVNEPDSGSKGHGLLYLCFGLVIVAAGVGTYYILKRRAAKKAKAEAEAAEAEEANEE